MGGIFSAPTPPPMPAPEPLPDPAIEEKKLRVEAMDRRRRGRAGTITTSDRGILTKSVNVAKKKTLLGE